MRPLLLALSATALLAIGTAFSLQAMRPPAPQAPAAPEAVAAAPPAAAESEVHAASFESAAGTAGEPTPAAVVKVRTVRIDPQLPVAAAPAVEPPAAPAADVRQPDAAAAAPQSGEPAVSRARPRAATQATPAATAPEEESVKASPRPHVRTAHAKSPEITGKRASRARRKADPLAGDEAAKDSLSYAPKEPGPESLNPLGRLLSGR